MNNPYIYSPKKIKKLDEIMLDINRTISDLNKNYCEQDPYSITAISRNDFRLIIKQLTKASDNIDVLIQKDNKIIESIQHKSVPYKLINIHKNMSAEFWVYHDTKKCPLCNEVISK